MAADAVSGRPAALEIRLFNSFEGRVHGEPLPSPRSSKSHSLLALLVLRESRAASRSWLAGTIWPDSTQERALYNLRRSLTDVRSLLGPEAWRLRREPPHSVRLELSGAACDALEFDACASQDEPGALERAVALYRGPLLECCSEAWVLPERMAREVAYLRALEQLAAHALAAGDPSRAVGYLRRILVVDPLRESAHRRLMEALAASGDPAAATQVYRDLRLLLHQELNAAPSPETAAVAEQIRAGGRSVGSTGSAGSAGSAGSPSTPHTPHTPRTSLTARTSLTSRLPRPLSSLVGRDRETAEVCARLAAARLVTLTGAGGVGKTRLAIRVAGEPGHRMPGGAWFVDLTSLADPVLLPQAVAAALDVREEAGRSVLETLEERLQGDELLLVLDNCEHVTEAAAAMAHALLTACPNLRILATSREPLNTAGEFTWRVPSLSVPPGDPHAGIPETSEPLPGYDAVRLFIERATQARSDFAPTPRNLQAVARICRHLDGIPLAIELAAARLQAMSAEQLAGRLDDSLNLLAGGGLTAPPRHRTLRAALEWSYATLTEPEQTLLRRLAVFAGGCTLEAAEAVCSRHEGFRVQGSGFSEDQAFLNPEPRTLNSNDPRHQVLDLLTHLVSKSMVAYSEENGAGRYRLLETVRQFARERLVESGERERLRAQHGACFLRLLEESRRGLWSAEQARVMRELEAEHDNLRAALDWHHAAAPAELELRFINAIGTFWCRSGAIHEGRQRVEAALSRPDATAPTPELAGALFWAGVLANAQDDAGTMCRYYHSALSLFRQLNMRQSAAACLNNLGCAAAEEGDFGAARAMLEEALATYCAIEMPHGEMNVLQSLGCAACGAGELEAARARWQEALRLARELGDQRAEAENLLRLGELTCERGDLEQAHQLCQDALALVRSAGDLFLEAACLHSLSLIGFRRGAWATAEADALASLSLLAQIANRPRAAECLGTLGRLAAAQGELERAATLFGAMETLGSAGRSTSPLTHWDETERERDAVREQLDEMGYQTPWSAGRRMRFDQAVAFALGASFKRRACAHGASGRR